MILDLSAAMAAEVAENDRVVRELLGRWVSELDPAVVMGLGGRVIGLCPACAEGGSEPFILRRP